MGIYIYTSSGICGGVGGAGGDALDISHQLKGGSLSGCLKLSADQDAALNLHPLSPATAEKAPASRVNIQQSIVCGWTDTRYVELHYQQGFLEARLSS